MVRKAGQKGKKGVITVRIVQTSNRSLFVVWRKIRGVRWRLGEYLSSRWKPTAVHVELLGLTAKLDVENELWKMRGKCIIVVSRFPLSSLFSFQIALPLSLSHPLTSTYGVQYTSYIVCTSQWILIVVHCCGMRTPEVEARGIWLHPAFSRNGALI